MGFPSVGTGHVTRPLVGAQAQKDGMAQNAVACPFGEGDLGDEIGLHPAGAAANGARDIEERRFIRQARLELGAERSQDRPVITGADTTAIDEPATLVIFPTSREAKLRSFLSDGR